MPYTPKTWENKPSTASPINATNLNHMEGGIKTNDDNIVGAQNAILTLQGEMLQAQGDISALETLVDSIFPVDTETGNPAVITDAFGGACKSLKLTLEPIQSGSGTPSPQNVRPISGRTQSVVTRCGKNACPYVESGGIDRTTGLDYSDASLARTGFIPIKRNTTYTISANVSRIAVCVFKYDSKKTYIDSDSTIDVQASSAQFNYDCDYIRLQAGVTVIPTTANVQVEVGSTATPYEPYNGESITIQLGQTVYGGVLDVTSGVLTIDKAIVDLGSLTWIYNSTAGTMYAASPSDSAECVINGLNGVSDIYECYIGPYNTFITLDKKFTLNNRTLSATKYITIRDTDYTDKDAFTTSVTGHKLVYPLATPTTVQLTPAQIALLHGDNVLTTDADSVEASYSADIALYITKKITEGSQGNRSLSKGGSSDEEVKEEAKEEEIEIKEEEPLTKEVR